MYYRRDKIRHRAQARSVFYDALRGVTKQRPWKIIRDTACFLGIILVLTNDIPCRKAEASKSDGFVIGRVASFSSQRSITDCKLNTIQEHAWIVALTEKMAKELPNEHLFITVPLYNHQPCWIFHWSSVPITRRTISRLLANMNVFKGLTWAYNVFFRTWLMFFVVEKSASNTRFIRDVISNTSEKHSASKGSVFKPSPNHKKSSQLASITDRYGSKILAEYRTPERAESAEVLIGKYGYKKMRDSQKQRNSGLK